MNRRDVCKSILGGILTLITPQVVKGLEPKNYYLEAKDGHFIIHYGKYTYKITSRAEIVEFSPCKNNFGRKYLEFMQVCNTMVILNENDKLEFVSKAVYIKTETSWKKEPEEVLVTFWIDKGVVSYSVCWNRFSKEEFPVIISFMDKKLEYIPAMLLPGEFIINSKIYNREHSRLKLLNQKESF